MHLTGDPAVKIRSQGARAEAWKRYALRVLDQRDAIADRLAEERADLGPCPRCEEYRRQLNGEIREGQRAERDAYAEGRAAAREYLEVGGW